MKIAKVLLVFFPIILLPPIADFILTQGKGHKLMYIMSAAEFKDAFFNFFILGKEIPGASMGIRIEIILIMSGLFVYILVKTKNIFKTLITTFLTYIAIGLIGSVPFLVTALTTSLLKLFKQAPVAVDFIFNEANCFINTKDARIEIVMLFLSIIFIFLILSLSKSSSFKSILKDFRWTRFLHYFFTAAFGFIFGFKMVAHHFYAFAASQSVRF